jgi:hypothetical protein
MVDGHVFEIVFPSRHESKKNHSSSDIFSSDGFKQISDSFYINQISECLFLTWCCKRGISEKGTTIRNACR